MFLMKAYADAGSWVTINGTHVLIGASGKIVKGPAKFIGSTVEEIKSADKSSINDSKVSSKATKSNPTGMTLKERGEAIRKVKDKYQNADSSTINRDLEKNKKIMQSSEIGTEKYTKARINVLALQNLKSDRNNSSMTTEQKVGFMSSNTLVHSGGNPSKPLINPAKVSGTIQQKRFSETAKSVSSNTSGSSKYPSGITTTAQKRAYTRAINSGKSASEAKASALGKAVSPMAQRHIDEFNKSSTRVKGTRAKMSNSDIKKMSTETLLRTHNDLQSKMTVAGFKGDKKSMRRYENESLRLFEEYSKRISRGE